MEHRITRLILLTGGVALCLFVLSLGFYDRYEEGWQVPGRYELGVTQTSIGLPRWLTFHSTTSSGSPPVEHAEHLPAAGDLPRMQVDPLMLLVAVVGSIAGSLGLVVLASRARPLRLGWSHAVVAALALVVGALAPADPRNPIGLLMLGALPMAMVVLGWLGRRPRSLLPTALLATLVLWWALRTSDHFRTARSALREELLNDPLAPLLFLTCCLLAAWLAFRLSGSLRPGQGNVRPVEAS